jgi:hypothetical protein
MSLLNHTAVLYDMKGILDELGITQKEFRQICIISGTDYNIDIDSNENRKKPILYETLKYYKKYHKLKLSIDFYDWLNENTDYIKDYYHLNNIYNMFDLSKNHLDIKIFEKIKIINGPIQYKDMKEILVLDGFIF